MLHSPTACQGSDNKRQRECVPKLGGTEHMLRAGRQSRRRRSGHQRRGGGKSNEAGADARKGCGTFHSMNEEKVGLSNGPSAFLISELSKPK
jgi:hypothetical protein